MSTVILIIVLIFLVLTTKKRPINGLFLYFCIRMVIPSTARVLMFSFNTIALVCLLICLLPSLKKRFYHCSTKDKLYVKYSIKLFLMLFALTLFAFMVPKGYQWSGLIQMLGTEFLPSILILIFLCDKKEYEKFCNLIAVMTLFYAIYSIYTYVFSVNPISDFFNTSDKEGMDLIDYANGRMGLTGIAVGIYDDKIACSLIGLLLFMFVIANDKINKILRYSAAVFTLVTIFLTTQRTGLLCSFLFIGIMVLDKRKNNVIRKYSLVGIVLIFIFLSFNSNKIIDNAIYSILYLFDDNMQQKLGVGGSSMELRAFQYLNGISYLGLSNLFQGAGISFPQYYYSYIWNAELYGMDYRFAGFESFSLKILMSSGIVGLFAWTSFFMKVYKNFLSKNVYNFAFLVVYISAIIMTDASASFYLFFILLILNYKNDSLNIVTDRKNISLL